MKTIPLRDQQLQILWTSKVNYAKDCGVPAHHHPSFYQLLLVIEGEGLLNYEDTQIPLKKNGYYLIHENKKHGFKFNVPAVTLDYKFEVYDPHVKNWLNAKAVSGEFHSEHLSALNKLFKTSVTYNKIHHPVKALEIDSGFKSVLISLLEPDSARNHEIDYFDYPVAAYILENYRENITLEQLSRHFRYHSHYLISIFRKHTGKTPIQYLQQVRLDKAKELLEFVDLSISEIAMQVGLTPHYFSKLFYLKEGMTPSKYREHVQSSHGKDILLDDSFKNQWIVTHMDSIHETM